MTRSATQGTEAPGRRGCGGGRGTRCPPSVTLHLVLPPDTRRYRPRYNQRDRGLDALARRHDQLQRGPPLLAWLQVGYVSASAITRPPPHPPWVDVAQAISDRLGATRGGYSGVIDYTSTSPLSGRRAPTLPTWCFASSTTTELGRKAGEGGNIGAKAWGDQHDNWNIMLYGAQSRIALRQRRACKVDGTEVIEYPPTSSTARVGLRATPTTLSPALWGDQGLHPQPAYCPHHQASVAIAGVRARGSRSNTP